MSVYFIQKRDGTGPIKIGYAANPIWRLQAIEAMNPEPLQILATVEGTQQLERALHRKYAKFRVKGEWFEPAQVILDMIAKSAESGSINIRIESQRSTMIANMYREGSTLQQIGDRFDITRERARQILRKMGVESEGVRPQHVKKSIASRNREQVIELANNGADIVAISEAVGDSVQNVKNVLKKSGAPIKFREKIVDPVTLKKSGQIASAYSAGETTRSIAQRFGMAQPDIYHYLKVAGVTPSRKPRNTVRKEPQQ